VETIRSIRKGQVLRLLDNRGGDTHVMGRTLLISAPY